MATAAQRGGDSINGVENVCNEDDSRQLHNLAFTVLSMPSSLGRGERADPPWGRAEGIYLADFQGMLPDSGSILWGFHFWEVPFALMLSPGWTCFGRPEVRSGRLREEQRHGRAQHLHLGLTFQGSVVQDSNIIQNVFRG